MKRNQHNISGFTIIELVVVISIISLLLFFSIPSFDNFRLFQDSGSEIGRVVSLIEKAKKTAVYENTDFLMVIDTANQRIWFKKADSEEKETGETEKAGVALSDSRILDIVTPVGNDAGKELFKLTFSRKGHSDMAIIHFRDSEENDLTLRIEPFLVTPDLKSGYHDFGDCI